jgi:hypothetical protein
MQYGKENDMENANGTLTLDAPRGMVLDGIRALCAGRQEAALESFASALPGESELWALCSARLHLLRGEMHAARVRLEEVVARAPSMAEAHFMLGQVHRAACRTFEAMASFREALRREPSHRRAAAALAELLEVQEP